MTDPTAFWQLVFTACGWTFAPAITIAAVTQKLLDPEEKT